MIDALAFERKADHYTARRSKRRPSRQPEKMGTHGKCDRCTCSGRQWRWRRSRSTGDSTERAGRPFASGLVYQTKIATPSSAAKKPRTKPYWAGDGVSAGGVSSGRGGRGGLSSVDGVSPGGVWRDAAAGRSGISECTGFESFFRGGAGTAAV
jgi:hypothetical protein